jgi:hypothetical protein
MTDAGLGVPLHVQRGQERRRGSWKKEGVSRVSRETKAVSGIDYYGMTLIQNAQQSHALHIQDSEQLRSAI